MSDGLSGRKPKDRKDMSDAELIDSLKGPPGTPGSALPGMTLGDMLNFDPHAFMKQIEKEPLHVIDLTGDEPLEYIILPTVKGEVKYQEPKIVDGYTYEEWMKEVNEEVIMLSGVSNDDLGDWNSYDAWANGSTVKEGAIEALEGSDFPFEDE